MFLAVECLEPELAAGEDEAEAFAAVVHVGEGRYAL
jgi:hypothetical protein